MGVGCDLFVFNVAFNTLYGLHHDGFFLSTEETVTHQMVKTQHCKLLGIGN